PIHLPQLQPPITRSPQIRRHRLNGLQLLNHPWQPDIAPVQNVLNPRKQLPNLRVQKIVRIRNNPDFHFFKSSLVVVRTRSTASLGWVPKDWDAGKSLLTTFGCRSGAMRSMQTLMIPIGAGGKLAHAFASPGASSPAGSSSFAVSFSLADSAASVSFIAPAN